MDSAKKDLNQLDPSAKQVENIAEDGFEKSDPAFDAVTKGQGVTGYEDLGVLETIKTFKICTLVCFAMAFSAATDGYQIGYFKFREYKPYLAFAETVPFLGSMPVLSQTRALLRALPQLLAKTESLPLHHQYSVGGARSCPVARSSA